MAGIDTRGLASGFSQGFGMVENYYNRQSQNERADERMSMERERFDMQKEEVDRARKQEGIQLALSKVANGMQPSEEEVELLRESPKYWKALDQETDNSLAIAEAVVDPESPTDINSPESIEALNQMFEAEINKGEGGQKRISKAFPGPDGETLMFDLEVLGEDGESYEAPMTDGRAPGGDDDTVMQVPVEEVIKQVQGLRAIRSTMQTPEAQEQASQMLRILNGEPEDNWEVVERSDGAVLQRNTRTGETKRVLGRETSGGSGYGRSTSDMTEAQWLVDNGIAENIEEAYDKVRSRAGQNTDYGRQQDEMRYVRERISEITKIRDEGNWRRLPKERRESLESELGELTSRRDELASSLYPQGGSPGLRTDGGSGSESDSQGDEKDEPKETGKDEPERTGDEGLRPGPAHSEKADQFLKDILG